jgi:hypothetical protein
MIVDLTKFIISQHQILRDIFLDPLSHRAVVYNHIVTLNNEIQIDQKYIKKFRPKNLRYPSAG